ncbi:hypothetical protein [Marinovum sp.]|uniref:hypothetical protein n=1 Tax=Marinovum sp. TaxID=2024839 RepID=UPI002B27A5DE|nr:hypothetical protein [Marinovum sp.]
MRMSAALPLLLWSTGAQALTCLPPDVAATYREAAESTDRYTVVVGALTFDETQLPVTDMANQQNTPPETRIAARLTGEALTRAGFTFPYDREITLNAQCFGPWCAGAVSGAEYLAFVNLDRAVPEVAITPCGGFAFGQPTEAMRQRVIACFNGGDCVPEGR